MDTLTDMILKLLPTYDNNQMKPEEFDNLTHNRFNIKNYVASDYVYKNYYVFLIKDESSITGYKGMCINKEFYKKVKKANDIWEKNRR